MNRWSGRTAMEKVEISKRVLLPYRKREFRTPPAGTCQQVSATTIVLRHRYLVVRGCEDAGRESRKTFKVVRLCRKGLSQIGKIDFRPILKQQKNQDQSFDLTLVFVMAAHSVHNLFMLRSSLFFEWIFLSDFLKNYLRKSL